MIAPPSGRTGLVQELADASAAINGAHTVHALLRAAAEHARAIVDAQQAAVSLSLGPHSARVVTVTAVDQARPQAPSPGGSLTVPLLGAEGEELGSIHVYDRGAGEFTGGDWAIIVQLMQMSSLALERLWRETELRDERERVERLADQLRRLVVDAQGAEDRVRQSLAETLHDEVLQDLLAAGQDVQEAIRRLGVDPALTRAAEGIDRSATNLRDVVGELHPVALARGGLRSALAVIAARVSRQGGFKVEWSVSPDAEGLHDRLVLSLVRELLVNVAKHADAQRAWVTVSRGDDAVLVEVLDDGRGYPHGRLEEAARQGHIGLASAFEKARAVGGVVELTSGPGRARARFCGCPCRSSPPAIGGAPLLRSVPPSRG